jgi:hypothetical protein
MMHLKNEEDKKDREYAIRNCLLKRKPEQLQQRGDFLMGIPEPSWNEIDELRQIGAWISTIGYEMNDMEVGDGNPFIQKSKEYRDKVVEYRKEHKIK